MEEITVVNETEVGGRRYKEMSDRSLRVEAVNKPSGSMYGDYITIPEAEFTEDKLKEAKALLVGQICEVIKKLAEEHEDFFIIKKFPNSDVTSVGWKIFFPTIN